MNGSRHRPLVKTRLQISERPLIGIFGRQSACQVLLYLENYDKGYASETARTFGISLNQAQNQLRKFEDAGLLVSRGEGSIRMFGFGAAALKLSCHDQWIGWSDAQRRSHRSRIVGLNRMLIRPGVRWVAIIGGYQNRKHDPPPGHQLMWYGYVKLAGMCEGYLLHEAIK